MRDAFLDCGMGQFLQTGFHLKPKPGFRGAQMGYLGPIDFADPGHGIVHQPQASVRIDILNGIRQTQQHLPQDVGLFRGGWRR